MDSFERIALPEPPPHPPPQASATATTHRSKAIRTDIEGLRAIAILLVVTFDAGVTGMSGGFIGVDVFYVLSGYLITRLLVAEIRETGRVSLLNFYARRVRRLLPAAALVLFATLAVAGLIFAPSELNFAARTARSSALYISNLFFMQNAQDYFGARVGTNPLLHTWSLSIEEQFYLFWPLLIMLGLRVLGSVRGLWVLLASLTLVSLAASIWLTPAHQIFTFYALPARAWEFGIGGLAALMPAGSLKLSRSSWLALGWIGMTLVLGCATLLTAATPFPGWVALLPVAGTTLILTSGAEHPHTGACQWLDRGLMQKLGELSYSWYLWHRPFLIFAAALVPEIGPAGKATVIAGSLAIAQLTHRYIENPIRFNPGLVKRPALSLFGAVAVGVTCVIAASLSVHFADRLGQEPEMAASNNAMHDVSSIERARCVTDDEAADVKSCIFGSSTAATTVVLFGDLHAIPWFEPLQTLAAAHGWELTTFLKSGCSATEIVSRGDDDVEKAQCTAWRNSAINRIIDLHPTLVVLGSASNHLWRSLDPNKHATDEELTERVNGTRHVVAKLTAAGLHVALIRDNPEFSYDVPTCLGRAQRHAWYPSRGCAMPIAAVLDPKVFEAEKRAVKDLPGVTLIDLTGELCRNGICPGARDGLVIYRDTNHLTGHFAASLTAALEPQILAALGANGTDRQDPAPTITSAPPTTSY